MSYYKFSSAEPSYHTLPLNAMLHTFDEAAAPSVAILMHNHEALEVNVILKGTMIMTVDGREYRLNPGDALLCNPFALHTGHWEEGCHDGAFIGFTLQLDRFLMFKDSPLSQSCQALLEGRVRFDEFYPAEEGLIFTCIEKIMSSYTDKSLTNECRTMSLAYELLEELFSSHYHAVKSEKFTRRNVSFLREAAKYVQENFVRDIGTADVAASMHMEISQFCHTFKRHFGVSFTNHLCRYRCVRAAELYQGTEMSIADIASAVGFSDYCYFSPSFKKYIGQTPALYFGKWKGPSQTS